MSGMTLRALAGASRYEFRMQLRRRALWITIFALAAMFLAPERRFWSVAPEMSLGEVVGRWAIAVNLLLPIAVGTLLADRFPRDRRTHVDELFETLPVSSGARLWGKYLGSTAATIVPYVVIYLAGLGHILFVRHDLRAIPLGLAAFLTINLPGLLFIASFSVACPVILWAPLYQFLFVGYWFWGNLMVPQVMPTLSQTWLAPIGWNTLFGFFHGDLNAYGQSLGTRTVRDGIASMALLLGCAVIPLVAADWYLRWRQAHA
jgi:ABC-2 type transport system permease protein